ncbi:MAG: cyclase family protein [Gammaproteobacteria bacterium]|nr:cyclase family protein [Gammaproteobacteria bacterium]
MAEPSLHERLAAAKVYDLGQAYWPSMPVHPFDPPFQFYLYRYHEYTEKDLGKIEAGFGDAISLMITSMHSGTHFDIPIHMSQDYKVQGIDVREYQRDTGFVDLPEPLHSMESVPPLLLRAALFDIPRLKGLDVLPERYSITVDDLEAAAEQQGITVEEGGCLLVRTGYAQFFETDADTYLHKWAGLSPEAVRWLAARKPRLVGTDNLSIGVPNLFDAHRVLLVENGIYVMKSLTLESLAQDQQAMSTVVVLPLKIKGGEASLVRPIAIA